MSKTTKKAAVFKLCAMSLWHIGLTNSKIYNRDLLNLKPAYATEYNIYSIHINRSY